MEDNQKQKKNNSHSSLSVTLSFILAFVAIISLVSVGIGKISFAIPNEEITQFPDTITVGNVEEDPDKVVGKNYSDKQINIMKATVGGITKYVYCIESSIGITSNVEYTKNNEVEDKGLLFLSNYLLSDQYRIVDASGNEVPEKAKSWIIQSAIWIYQDAASAANSDLTTEEVAAIKKETALITRDNYLTPFFESTTPIYDSCKLEGSDLGSENTINKIVAKAINIHNGTDNWNINDIKANFENTNIIKVGDDYESSKVTVTPTTQGFLGYKIDLSTAPEGTYIVDESKNKIEQLDDITEGKQFYLRVPIKSLTDDNKDVTIQIVGAFQNDIAYKYVSTGKQSIILGGKATKHIVTGLDNTFNLRITTESTGSNFAKIFYAIGLVLLLMGVAVVYANVKTIKLPIKK